jgi:hypothetical protein
MRIRQWAWLWAAWAVVGSAHAQTTSPHAAVLKAPTQACTAEITKKVLDLHRRLPASDIPGDLFTASPYATLRSSAPDASGKIPEYVLYMKLDPFDKACYVREHPLGGGRVVPSCSCDWVDPVAAAKPFDVHASLLIRSGRFKAIEQACAASANRVEEPLSEYRKATLKYVDFKLRVPAALLAAKQLVGLQERYEAWLYGRALPDLQNGLVDEKAYANQMTEMNKVLPGELDTACAGARNVLQDRIVAMAWEMKTYAVSRGLNLD